MMKYVKYLSTECPASTEETVLNNETQELKKVFFASICEYKDGTIGFLKHEVPYESFKGAVEDEFVNPTPPAEKEKLLDLQVGYWKGYIDKKSAAFYTFSFLTASSYVSKSTLETYREQQTFGIVIHFKEGVCGHKIITMPLDSWYKYTQEFEGLYHEAKYRERFLRQITDTFFELNYDLHHSRILDNDENAAMLAEVRINNSLEMFASIFTKISNTRTITQEESLEQMKTLNKFVFEQTKKIVQEHGRNHYSGNYDD